MRIVGTIKKIDEDENLVVIIKDTTPPIAKDCILGEHPTIDLEVEKAESVPKKIREIYQSVCNELKEGENVFVDYCGAKGTKLIIDFDDWIFKRHDFRSISQKSTRPHERRRRIRCIPSRVTPCRLQKKRRIFCRELYCRARK